jgi:hypothetical protein
MKNVQIDAMLGALPKTTGGAIRPVSIGNRPSPSTMLHNQATDAPIIRMIAAIVNCVSDPCQAKIEMSAVVQNRNVRF